MEKHLSVLVVTEKQDIKLISLLVCKHAYSYT